MKKWTFDEAIFLWYCQRTLLLVCGCPSQRHGDVADPNDWDIIGRAREGGLCWILMKLGTKLPPGLINLPKTAFVFLCNAPNTSYIPFLSSEGVFGSYTVDREEAAFKKLRSCSISRTSTVCVGIGKWGERRWCSWKWSSLSLFLLLNFVTAKGRLRERKKCWICEKLLQGGFKCVKKCQTEKGEVSALSWLRRK